MRTRVVPLLLLAAVALIALYGRRSLLSPSPDAPTTAGRTEFPSRSAGNAASSVESGASRRRGTRAETGSQAGSFDFYLLNLSWSPEFCATHPGKPECAAHLGFVLHGLWPQNNDGSYPQDCSDAPGPSDPGSYSDILPDAGLLAHEWKTHGTCSGLGADAYFDLARKAVHEVAIPASVAQITTTTSRSPQSILSDFSTANAAFPTSGFALSCGNNYLTAIEVCLSKSLTPIACPAMHTCRANTVRIVPPGIPQ